ncbi:MAG: nascent polypeptide-associated complex protein [Candidatus Nanohaloarchaea archaeon]
MIPGNKGDMAKMMKQMGVDMEEIDADRVEVKIGDRKLVFEDPDLSKLDVQGNEIFQLKGVYEEQEDISQEDVELVVEKTGASEEEAREALKDSEDVADAVMSLQ